MSTKEYEVEIRHEHYKSTIVKAKSYDEAESIVREEVWEGKHKYPDDLSYSNNTHIACIGECSE